MSSKSLTQSKVLSPTSKSSSFYHIDIPAQSFLANESFAKQNFTPVQNQEESTPYLQYIAHEQTNSVSTGFNLQSKILSVLKKDDRSYNESVFVYKHLKPSAFFQKFRQDHPNLRLTEALINLSKILEYHVFSPGAIIHRKGDPSNKRIYLVFSGKIDLYETIEKKSGFETPRPPAPKLENKAKSTFSLLGNREESKTPKASARSEKPQPPQNVILNTRALVGQAAYEVAQEISTLNACKSNTDIKSFKFEPTIDEEVNDKTGGNKAFRGGKKILKKMKTVAFALSHAKTALDLDKVQGSSCRNGEIPLQDSGRHFTSIDNLDSVMMKVRKEESTSIVMDVEEEKEKKPVMEFGLQKSVTCSLAGAKNKFRKNFLKASFKGVAEEDLPKSSNREEFVDSQTSIENHMQSDREMKIKKGSVYKGEIFGDESLEKVGYANYEGFDYKRKYTAQVGGDKECVLLSFCREDYEYLCTRYDPENTRVLDFLLDYVPDLDKTAKEENLRRLESHFSEETYNWHQQVTVQGQRGDKIYLLFDGLCEVLKEVRSGSCGADLSMSGMTDLGRATSVQGLTRDYSYGNKVMSILICVVKSGVFLGEEILFNGTGEYEYTVKAGSTKVRLLELDKETFFKIMPERVQKSLRNLYNQKTKHNQEILNSKLQLQADFKQQRSGVAGVGPTGALFDSFDESKEIKEKKSSQTQRKFAPNMVQSRVIKSLVTITSKVVENLSTNKQQIYGLNDVKKESEISLRRYLESEPSEKRNAKEMTWNNVIGEGFNHSGKKRPRVLLKKKKGSILRSENNIARPSSEMEEKRFLGNKSPQMSSTVQALTSPKASSKRIEKFRFDFGRDLSESLLVKEIDVERDREARLVLKLRKKMMDRERNVNNGSRPSTTTTASYYLKNGSFASVSNNTPKNNNTAGSEPTWSAWGSPNTKASGTPTSNMKNLLVKDSVNLSSPIHSVKPKMTKRFSFKGKEVSQKALVEKTGRAYSLNVIQKPLKDEARDEYPAFELFGKGLV